MKKYNAVVLLGTAMFFLILTTLQQAAAQENETIILKGYPTPYMMTGDKIYKDTIESPEYLIATIHGNQLLKDSSTSTKDVLFTFTRDKIYETGKMSQQTLLFYRKENQVMLRTKDGQFRPAALISKDSSNGLKLLGYLQPLEFFALKIASKDFIASMK